MSDLVRPQTQSNVSPNAPKIVRTLPDVAQESAPESTGRLDRVGMSGIECLLETPGRDGASIRTPARADAFVSLDDPDAKGIHMSRLFLALQRRLDEGPFTLPTIADLLREFVGSHAGLSRRAEFRVRYEHFERRDALLSEHSGWRSYPVTASGVLDGDQIRLQLQLRVAYSSTCPCSAALSRQLLREHFEQSFAGHNWVSVGHVGAWLATEEAMAAAPHSQRSFADVTVVPLGDADPSIAELIELVEAALQTAVQAAVKREDEQDFARICGANLMFCEDAARRIKAALEQTPSIADYRVQANHLESLHPHDAVAVAVKGVPGGLAP